MARGSRCALAQSLCLLLGCLRSLAVAEPAQPARHLVSSRPPTCACSISTRALNYLVPHTRAHVHQRARLAAPDLRLGAVASGRRCCCRTSPTTATPASRRRRQHAAAHRRRAAVANAFETIPAASACTRLMNHEMVHVATTRHRVERGPALARASSSARSPPQSAAPRVAALQLPDGAALHGAALVPRGQRGVHGDLDGRRPRPRPGRLRRDGVSRDGARRRAFLRSARARVARHPRRLPGRRQRLPLRHALLHLARLRATRPRRWSPG